MTARDEGAAWRLAAALTALNVLSFVDRQLVVTLAPLIMADLGLSRAQIGLLVGASFIVVYGVLTLGLGAAADRVSRPRLIAAGLLVWSLATALTAGAQGFLGLAALRLAVGVGEAALPATALAMLGDRFPAGRLGTATSVFYAGIPVGFAISFGLSAWLGPWLGWRACFAVLGALGLLAVAGALALPDAPRRAAPPVTRHLARTLRAALAARPALALVFAGGALLVFMSAASQHVITWLVQERGIPYGRAAALAGVLVALGGLVGNVGIGAFADRWYAAGRPLGRLGGLVALGGVALPSTAAFYLLPPESAAFLPCWFVSQAFMLGWFGPVTAEMVEQAPEDLRATVVGLGLMVINLFGVALGPWVTGLIGDAASLTRGLLVSLAVGAAGLVTLALAGARRPGGMPTADRGTIGE